VGDGRAGVDEERVTGRNVADQRDLDRLPAILLVGAQGQTTLVVDSEDLQFGGDVATGDAAGLGVAVRLLESPRAWLRERHLIAARIPPLDVALASLDHTRL
jgi:hypothetical protein